MSFLLQVLFLLTFPLVVASAFTCLMWNVLKRPWAYLGISLVLLYAMYCGAFYLLDSRHGGYILSVRQPGDPVIDEPWLIVLAPYARQLIAFLVLGPLAAALLARVFVKRAG